MEIKKWICFSSTGLLSFPIYCFFIKVLLKRRVKSEKRKKMKKERKKGIPVLSASPRLSSKRKGWHDRYWDP